MLYLGVFDPTTTSFEQNEFAHLQRALSRAPDDNVEVITRRSFALVTVQDSDFGDAAMHTGDDENAGVVFGRPYLKEEAKDDAMAVLQAVFEEDHMSLARARGSYCGVVFQRSQFSFVRGRSLPAIPRAGVQWKNAVAVAQIVDRKLHESPIGKALFFHARRVSPGWHLTRVATLGNHVFYR